MPLDIPVTECPISGVECQRNLDCTSCDVFRAAKPDVIWVCGFCYVDFLRAWPGVEPDSVAIPGIYTSGICARCGCDRIALMAIQPRRK